MAGTVVQSATGDGNCDLLAVLVSVLAHTFHANAARRLCLLPCSVACCCFLPYELSANTAFCLTIPRSIASSSSRIDENANE